MAVYPEMFTMVNKLIAVGMLQEALLADDKDKQSYLWKIAQMLRVDDHPVLAQLNVVARGMPPIAVNDIVMYVNHMTRVAEKAMVTYVRDPDKGIIDLSVFPTDNEPKLTNHTMVAFSEKKILGTWHLEDK